MTLIERVRELLDYDPEIVPKAIDILAKAVEDGRLPAERIIASYRRIQAVKQQLYTQFACAPQARP